MTHFGALRPALVLVLAHAADATALEQETAWLAEAQFTGYDGEPSWTDRGPGKLRGDDADAAVRLSLDYRLHFTDTIAGHANLEGYAGSDSNGGVTEAWLEWNPVPTSPWAFGMRAGSVIPPFSMEHLGTGWTSPYMPTASIMNSWTGEELRTDAVELTVERLGAQARSPHSLSFRAAVFSGNDTSGTILSWRGWAANDRVTPLGDDLPLPRRPALQPGGPFPGASSTDPFLEIDDEPGYYATAGWEYRHDIELVLGRYDNRADPLAFRDGQAGWRTRFNVAGARWRIDESTRIIAQVLDGDTIVGRRGSRRSADNDFTAWYVLASRDWRAHRFSTRFERFEVEDLDPTPLDDNREDGHAWSLAWQYEIREGMTLGAEYLRLDYDRPGRLLLDLDAAVSEEQTRAMLRYRF